jgi:hypothetical protein
VLGTSTFSLTWAIEDFTLVSRLITAAGHVGTTAQERRMSRPPERDDTKEALGCHSP